MIFFCCFKERVNKHKNRDIPKILALDVGIVGHLYFLFFLKYPQDIILIL